MTSIIKLIAPHFDFQFLRSEWIKMLSPKDLGADITAGITVAFVAIPLSLAIALASGVPPATGLITAIIAGIVCALFGGASLAVSGPAAAMSVLLADIVERYGFETLVFIGLIAGLMQLISGVLGLGKLTRYVPLPVIAGFTAGIGVIILIGQLPRAFGLTPPPAANIYEVLNHIKEYFDQINGTCLLIVVVTFTIIKYLPKFLPKVPPILPAVIVATLLVAMLNLKGVPLIGDIPRTLPAPNIPSPPSISLYDLILTAFTVYLLASFETLLSASAIDKLKPGRKFNANQELIGQGIGNVAVALFGGMPVTGVIARSATNIRAGAKTRRASIIHSLMILCSVYLVAPYIALIPIAALAAVLFSVAFSMINYKEFYELWTTAKAEAVVYALTFISIIFVDLIAGVQVGMITACIILLFKAMQSRLLISKNTEDGVLRLIFTGPLTFLSLNKIDKIEKRLNSIRGIRAILLDMANITNLDTSGATAIVDLFNHCQEKQIQLYIKGLTTSFEQLLNNCGGARLTQHGCIVSENELKYKADLIPAKSAHGRLLYGVQRFHIEKKHVRIFDQIRKRQDPHTLFIACSDSRIVPNLITSTEPGELFIIRNVGNYIPQYNKENIHGEMAAIEFALTELNITDIVICGHNNCGAMRACTLDPETLSPKLQQWITMIKSQLSTLNMDADEIARLNVLNQMENLKAYPIVNEKIENNQLTVHGWFFDFDTRSVYEWDAHDQAYKNVIRDALVTH